MDRARFITAATVLVRHEPRGDSRPRLSGGALLRHSLSAKGVELRSTGQTVPTCVVAPHGWMFDGISNAASSYQRYAKALHASRLVLLYAVAGVWVEQQGISTSN